MFDAVDVIFDFPGYISGYAMSSDFRYLHVNMRPWPKGAIITNPHKPPPAALRVERVVLDLAKMEVVGRSHPRQRVFIPSDSFEPSPLQVSNHFITTTIKDMGFIIDRHSGVTIASLPHPGITKCIVNPANSDMALTVGDDGICRVWRSKRSTSSVLRK
eukprot:TRINITY_DN36132_c0_g1_i1.p1 TRINITY_DN36132_c0_g1~~TRINITY_DN36132_c0_g1_i1.p1  ORF type:complete len:159 (-),score=31.37 TRINITY_DN36132_c0_g1_i1:18-494(-)